MPNFMKTTAYQSEFEGPTISIYDIDHDSAAGTELESMLETQHAGEQPLPTAQSSSDFDQGAGKMNFKLQPNLKKSNNGDLVESERNIASLQEPVSEREQDFIKFQAELDADMRKLEELQLQVISEFRNSVMNAIETLQFKLASNLSSTKDDFMATVLQSTRVLIQHTVKVESRIKSLEDIYRNFKESAEKFAKFG
jgi:hypothetical protein